MRSELSSELISWRGTDTLGMVQVKSRAHRGQDFQISWEFLMNTIRRAAGQALRCWPLLPSMPKTTDSILIFKVNRQRLARGPSPFWIQIDWPLDKLEFFQMKKKEKANGWKIQVWTFSSAAQDFSAYCPFWTSSVPLSLHIPVPALGKQVEEAAVWVMIALPFLLRMTLFLEVTHSYKQVWVEGREVLSDNLTLMSHCI